MSDATEWHVRELVVKRSGCPVHASVRGSESAPLVVLSHGAAMDHRMFDPQLAPLLDAGYRVMTVDLRGHGKSKPVGEVPFMVTDLADDVLALVDQLGVDRFVIIGQSMGGYVAQDLVLRYPDRIVALGIIGSTCITAPLTRLEMFSLRTSPLWFRLWPWGNLRRTVAKATAVTDEARAYAYDAVSALRKQEFIAVWNAVALAVQPRPGYRIEHPLLLTHGDQDRTGNIRRSAPAWAERDPRARYKVIANAGHNANQDNPEFFNRILLEFLSEFVSTGRAAQ
ncbi:alpha/beta fold hydrolase [Phytoactinopolyspora mesophila]|uniref:Alpha/beta fold hydrolase n=1 Tax=Phytoactinopolyspora mesophila TaxID=2650750 RepID=A0A7K3LZU7_9ACTN|nr:alpha/beta hydrolase [Phytoactinopolyspora mesophila]NDL56544.1 alpha/beta fold hydrolase [Phytoactinopolyspora mesophila]